MTETLARLDELLTDATAYMKNMPLSRWSYKPNPEKWSKKEILGHLIDSAINNLQRFTEIQHAPRPFVIRKYRQDDLVIANAYQQAMVGDILDLWVSLNRRIARVIELQSEQTLAYEIIVGGDQIKDLRFLMDDYVDHLQHHLRQIMD